ncbi:MAG: lipid II flippase MurJ, partial [Verrucomicrobiota bacterium]
LLTVPSTLGLMFLADPIISVIFEHGRFDAEATRQTASALRFYAVGLAAYSGIKVLAPAFYTIDRRTTPMLVSFGAIGLNLLLNWWFTFRMEMGHRGLALSTGCVAIVNFTLLYLLMRNATGSMETRRMIVGLVKLAIAGAALGAVCFWGNRWLAMDWALRGTALRVTELLGVILAAAIAFFTVAVVLRVEEMDDLLGVVRRRIARRKAASK